MKICIVNPGRCGSTVVLASLANKLDNFSMIYEVINYENGLYVLQANQNIIFKYQFLYALTPLKGADKYIIVDRKDKDAWIYSTYMSAVNYHWHGSLKNTENIYLAIYDLLGREIYTIHNGLQRSGNHNVQWTGINNQGDLAPSGVYFCRLKTEVEVLTKKMVLNR